MENKDKIIVITVITIIFGIVTGPETILEALLKVTLKTFVRDESLKIGFFVLRE
jgi:hypothetical protein